MSAHAWLAVASAWVWPRLVNHLWEGTLLALLVFLAALALRSAPARARHRLWLLLAVKLAVPSLVVAGALAWLPRAPSVQREAAPAVEAVGRWMTVAPVPHAVLPATSPGSHSEWLCVATLVWAAGVALTAGLRLRRRRALARLLATARPLTAGPVQEALARLRRRTGWLPNVRLLASPTAAHLGIAGVVRPVLLVPEALAGVLEPAELEAILEHELAHVRRRDPLVEALHAGLSCALWFFPVVWLLGRRLAVERERACDEEVLQRGGSAQVYLTALLKACRATLGAPLPDMVTATAVLRERIGGLLHPANPRGAGQHAACALVATACVTLAVARMPETRFQWRSVTIDASSGPVHLTAARARVVPAGNEEIVHPPEIRLENGSHRAVTAIRLGFGAEGAWHDVVDLPVSLPARGTAVLEPDWRTWHNTQPAASRAPLHARVEGVHFAGARPADERPAPAGPALPARFANLEGAPLTVTWARSWSVSGERTQVEVALRNDGSRAISMVKLRFKSDHPGHAVDASPVTLPPGGSLLFHSTANVPGGPAHMTVQVVGVAFADGGHWGLLGSSIDSREARVVLPEESR